jgi:hypothetical protein
MELTGELVTGGTCGAIDGTIASSAGRFQECRTKITFG